MKAVIFTALGFVFSAYASQASASCGTFEVAKGDVKVTAAGKESAAATGSKICSGDTVTACKDSRAKIKMEDGNELNISPDSKIVIETYQYDASANKKKVLLNVLKGKVRATTKTENMYNDKAKDGQANAFQVRTKSAVAGVRGTDFLTGYDQKSNTTTIVTFRGKVEVGMPGPGGLSLKTVQVAVGQKTEITGGQAPAIPKMLPAADLNKINVESISPPPAAAAPAPAPATTGASNGSASPATGDREPASASRPLRFRFLNLLM